MEGESAILTTDQQSARVGEDVAVPTTTDLQDEEQGPTSPRAMIGRGSEEGEVATADTPPPTLAEIGEGDEEPPTLLNEDAATKQEGEEKRKQHSFHNHKRRWWQTSPNVNLVFFCLSSLLFNWLAYFYTTGLSLICIQLDASSTELGIVTGLLAVAGTVGCVAFGFFSDKIPVALIGRVGAVFYAVAAIMLMFSKSMILPYFSAAMAGLAEAAFWPSIESQVGREAPEGKTASRASQFSISMAFGKSLGCLCAGFLIPLLGNMISLGIVIAGAGAVCLTIPLGVYFPLKKSEIQPQPDNDVTADVTPNTTIDISPSSGGSMPTMTTTVTEEADAAKIEQASRKSKVFLPLAYISNFMLYGIAGTLGSLLSQYLKERELTMGTLDYNELFGIIMAVVWAFQTMVFIVLAFPMTWWQWKRTIIYGFELAAAGACVGLGFINAAWQAFILVSFIGLTIGFSSMSSLAYSLQVTQEKKGCTSGIHEAMVQMGAAILPIAAGVLVDAVDEPSSTYWLCGFMMFICIPLQEAAYWLGIWKANRKANAVVAMQPIEQQP